MQSTIPQWEVFKSLLRLQTYILMLSYAVLGIAVSAVLSDITFSHIVTSEWHKLLGIALVIAFWYVNGTALNDYADYEIDMINLKGDKQRPLVLGLVSRQELLKYALVCGIFAASISFWLSLYHGILITVLLLLNIAYSLPPFRISRRGGLAPLLLPMGYIVLPIFSGFWILHSELPLHILLVALGMYIHFISRIILKDYRDVKGDLKNGKITFLLKHGNKLVTRISMISLVVSTVILCAVNNRYLGRASVLIALLLGIALKCLYELSKTEVWKVQKNWITYYGRMCSGIVTILIVALMGKSQFADTYKIQIMTVIVAFVFIWSTENIRQHIT